jgi:hypothetical protein
MLLSVLRIGKLKVVYYKRLGNQSFVANKVNPISLFHHIAVLHLVMVATSPENLRIAALHDYDRSLRQLLEETQLKPTTLY